MNRKQRINKLLSEKLTDFNIKIKDNSYLHVGHNNFDGSQETHLFIELNTLSKNKINRLSIHRKINDLLKNEFLNGLHSLEIKII